MNERGSQSGYALSLLARVITSHPLRFTFSRLLQAVPVLIGVTFLTFGMLNLLPGGAAVALAGDNPSPQIIATLNRELGLNRPFFDRYAHWILQVISGHLGASLLNHEPIGASLLGKLPVTIELIFLSMALALITAVPLAILATRRPNGVIDRISVALSMFGLSVPPFVLGLLLTLIFAVHERVLPATGFLPLSQGLGPNIRTLVLPVLTLSFGLFCVYSRVLRGDLRDEMLGEDYITVARAKGLGSWRILINHAFRNAAFNLLTLVGLNVGTLLGGTVVVETIFALPGIGQDLISSILARDETTVEAIVLILAASVVAANLLTDLLYSALDPRIRYGHSAS